LPVSLNQEITPLLEVRDGLTTPLGAGVEVVGVKEHTRTSRQTGTVGVGRMCIRGGQQTAQVDLVHVALTHKVAHVQQVFHDVDHLFQHLDHLLDVTELRIAR
jgi:hypothetical protein